MPYGSDAIKFVFSGTIDGAQEWSVGLNAAITLAGGTWGPTQLTAIIAQAITTPFTAWFAGIKQLWDATTILDTVTGYYYAAGSTSATYVGQVILGTPIAGTGLGHNARYCSLVLSLRSNAVGRSNRGRIYLPLTGAPLDSKGNVVTGTTTGMSTQFATMATAFNAADFSANGVTGNTIVVASLTKSTISDITSVVVDSKPDTQHRRTDKLAAEFQVASPITV